MEKQFELSNNPSTATSDTSVLHFFASLPIDIRAEEYAAPNNQAKLDRISPSAQLTLAALVGDERVLEGQDAETVATAKAEAAAWEEHMKHRRTAPASTVEAASFNPAAVERAV